MSTELIAKLRENISRHMKPYNLGDMGETETLIEKVIKENETLKAENSKMRNALEEIREIRMIDYSVYMKVQDIIRKTIK